MLGKQWKSEPDQVRAHYKALADEQKQKHAEEYPDYQYTPRRPCERKRRASSRQYAKNFKAAAAAGVAAANAKSQNQSQSQSQGMAESPASMTSAATLSSASTPGMQASGSMGRDIPDLNVYLGPNDLQDEQFNFDTASFDAMVQQLRNGQNQEFMLQPLEPAEQAAVDSFEFSDYIMDCF